MSPRPPPTPQLPPRARGPQGLGSSGFFGISQDGWGTLGVKAPAPCPSPFALGAAILQTWRMGSGVLTPFLVHPAEAAPQKHPEPQPHVSYLAQGHPLLGGSQHHPVLYPLHHLLHGSGFGIARSRFPCVGSTPLGAVPGRGGVLLPPSVSGASPAIPWEFGVPPHSGGGQEFGATLSDLRCCGLACPFLCLSAKRGLWGGERG